MSLLLTSVGYEHALVGLRPSGHGFTAQTSAWFSLNSSCEAIVDGDGGLEAVRSRFHFAFQFFEFAHGFGMPSFLGGHTC